MGVGTGLGIPMWLRRRYFDRNLVEANFGRGIVRDVPRHAEPVGGSYDLLDFFCDRPGMIYKRGGASYQCGPLAGMTDIIAVAAPEFPGDPRVVAFASNGGDTVLFDVTDSTTPGPAISANGALILENPPLYVNRLIVMDGRGTIGLTPHAPQKVYLDTGSVVIADIVGGIPTAAFSCLHAGRLVVANSVAHPNRVWFSPALEIEPTRFPIAAAIPGSAGVGEFLVLGTVTSDFFQGAIFDVEGSTGNDGNYTVRSLFFDGTYTQIFTNETVVDGTADGNLGISWDTNSAYIDVDEPVTGLASIQGVLLVFSRGSCQRILGDIPPGYGVATTLVNMALQPAIRVGCIDARSIVRDEDYVYVANESGLYALNGAGADNITTNNDASGINTLWSEMIDGFAPMLGSVVASGLFQNHLFVTVSRRANEAEAVTGQRNTIVRYLNTGAWSRLSGGAGAFMYATRFAPFYEMYYGLNDESAPDANRARKMGDVFQPGESNAQDPDGADIEPLWETRTLGMEAGVGMKLYDFGHLTYKLDTDGTATLILTESPGLEAGGAFVAAAESPFPASADITRQRLQLAEQNQGLTVRVQQDGSSEQTELYLLETLVRTLDPGGGP